MYRIKDPSSSQSLIKNSEDVARKNPSHISLRTIYPQEKKLFSLLDIDYKVTNARGTSLPFQYKRYSQKDSNSLFNHTMTVNKSQMKSPLTIVTENAYRRSCSKSAKKTVKTEPSRFNFPYSKPDKWKPKHFKKYEDLLHNPELITQESSNNKWASNLKMPSINDIREKSNSSDIFFTKANTIDTCSISTQTKYPNQMESDIFNIKNNATSQSKSGETFLYKPKKMESYTSSRESSSAWHSKNSMPTLLNHTSVKWNLLNPTYKSNARTKEQIVSECTKLNKSYNPNYRQKGLCEFIDLSRVGAPNPNKPYLECFAKTRECFRKRSDVCATYDDLHHMYKDLCDKPFIKPKYI